MRQTLIWLLTGKRPLWAAAVIAVLMVLIILSIVIKPIANYAQEQPQNATLVAALVALLGILITQIVNTILARSGQRNQQELEDRRARAASLQAYLEQMGELLLNHQLRNSDSSSETINSGVTGWFRAQLAGRQNRNAKTEGENSRAVAQAQTLAVLEGLDPTRKRLLIQFLYYSALIIRGKASISLAGANLTKANLSNVRLHYADLHGADLRAADLSHANLSYADLREADLHYATLHSAYLEVVDLSGANLSGADLYRADLREANLRETYLAGVNLLRADLSGANLNGANLHRAEGITTEELEEQAKSLYGATMPDGSKHD